MNDGIAEFSTPPHHAAGLLTEFSAILGVILLIGLWTPISGVACALAEASELALGSPTPRSSILLGAIGLALAMLGPGSWSADAIFFGRHRIDLPDE